MREWVSHIKKEPKYKQRSESKRQKYLQELKDIDISRVHYVDEMGANNNTVTTYGWSEKGKKTYSERLAYYTEKVNLLAA